MRIRQEKVNELLRQEISNTILKEIKDPRLGFVTVNRVETNKDLSIAKIYITVMGKDSDVNRTLKVLNSAKDYIRVTVGKKVKMRYIPNFDFYLDTKMEDTLSLLHLIEEDKDKHGYQ